MKQMLPWLLLAALLPGCRKADPAPEDQLPPATQEGRNTVGCLLNGQAWAPVGNGTSRNFFIDYDPTLGSGVFALTVEKYLADYPSYENLVVFANPFKNAGTYNLGDPSSTRAGFNSPRLSCYYDSRDTGTYCRGTLTITRLDKQARIISGTFYFTIAAPGCDTLRFTKGRFDKKL